MPSEDDLRMRRPVLLAFLVLLPALAAATAEPATPVPEGFRRVVAFGDTGVGPRAQANVEGALEEGATGFLGLGDYYYYDPPANWTRLFAPLLERGGWLAPGNHDAMPLIDPDAPDRWSVAIGGARVVGINSSRDMRTGSIQHAFARDALCGAPESLRVLAMHHPWWLLEGARHPASEFPASASEMDRLVRECGVDLVLAGHEHNYQRMVRQNVSYVIAGAGGQSLYPARGVPDGTVAAHVEYGRLVLDLGTEGFHAQYRTLDGRTLDAFNETPTPPTFRAAFSKVGGNEWWLQAVASATGGSVVSVSTSIDGGAWKPLEWKSWGAWAASYRAPEGSIVRFVARNAAGDASLSGCYRWTSAVPVECPGAPEPDPTPDPTPEDPPTTFSATYSGVKGNEWWVQARVAGSQPIAAVRAQVDGGAWRALDDKGWGWAASFRVREGSLVRFEAASASGATNLSGCYRWLSAAPAPCGAQEPPPQEPPPAEPQPPPAFNATFSGAKGNEWWLQVKVTSTRSLQAVDAQIDGGTWKPLTLRSYGDWAASYRVPAGSNVVFRATATDGAVAFSDPYRWPPS